jgi:hypothetical protein
MKPEISRVQCEPLGTIIALSRKPMRIVLYTDN